MSVQHSQRRFSAVQAEIDAERAASLGRVGRRLETHFARCQELLANLDDVGDHAVLTAYRTARAEFDAALYAYVVQREAIGLLDHRPVRAAYPRPPRR